jgi:hypothetical protein
MDISAGHCGGGNQGVWSQVGTDGDLPGAVNTMHVGGNKHWGSDATSG